MGRSHPCPGYATQAVWKVCRLVGRAVLHLSNRVLCQVWQNTANSDTFVLAHGVASSGTSPLYVLHIIQKNDQISNLNPLQISIYR